MQNQRMYGRIDNVPKPKASGPVYGQCRRCKASFIIEKPHKEIKSYSRNWARMKDGTLTSTTEKDVKFDRLCESCFKKFNDWLDQR